MILTGTISDIESQFRLLTELLKRNSAFSNSVSLNISFSVQDRQMLLIDGTTLREATLNTESTINSNNYFLIEQALYNLFMEQQSKDADIPDESVSVETSESWEPYDVSAKLTSDSAIVPIPYGTYPIQEKTQTRSKKTKAGSHKNKSTSHLTELANEMEEHPCFATLNDHYRIEDHLEESVRLQKPCAFGIKYIDDNYFILFYRRSVYEKGTDTSFRHFLCQQPGTLVAYRYFKDLASLRYIFEKQTLKLRHNGSNMLSRAQADRIVEYFTKCW